ncbi:MAG: beta-phosphoglucomutase [Saprospiraceae bacterium]
MGCIFDLDGVIVDTAKYHFQAWKKLANDLGFDFSEEQNEQLKGVSRVESLNLILNWGGVEVSEERKLELMQSKNENYLDLIEKMQPEEVLEGVDEFLEKLSKRKIPIALGSASKNAEIILEKVGLIKYFSVLIDGNKVSKSKPDPEVFLKGAEGLGLQPIDCVVFEDAEKGLQAALDGGFYTVGVGDPEVLYEAHYCISNFKDLDIDTLFKKVKSAK